ncbi:MAG: biotin/lipoyl-binding protein [candidate division Zixibacteria bacterium]|nr:biotin/lipoyl-binding protein [candidate division Zixibacteria bacterium]
MKLKITVHGVAYEVEVEVLDAGEGFSSVSSLPKFQPRVQAANSGGAAAAVVPPPAASPQSSQGSVSGSVASPIAGTVIEIKCKPGDSVTEGQVLLIIEAMKMKTSIAAPTSGKVKAVPVSAGDSVRESQILVEFE